MTSTGGPLTSDAVNGRPRSGVTANVEKNSGVTRMPTRDFAPDDVRHIAPWKNAADTEEKLRVESFHERYARYGIHTEGSLGRADDAANATTRRSAWGNRSGRKSHASVMLNAVTAAPIATASVQITTAAGPGFRRNSRTPWRASRWKSSTRDPSRASRICSRTSRGVPPRLSCASFRACSGVRPRRTPASISSSTWKRSSSSISRFTREPRSRSRRRAQRLCQRVMTGSSGGLQDHGDGRRQTLPVFLLPGQMAGAGARQRVVLGALAALGKAPFRTKETLMLQLVQRWIQRASADVKDIGRLRAKPLRDGKAVHRLQ